MIGSKKFSKVFHHSRWKLDWKNSTLDMLGIKFSVVLADMINLNYSPKITEIRKIINQWKMRKLSPLGRLTITKTLILTKLNHLILSLLNPTENYTKDFENDIYEKGA